MGDLWFTLGIKDNTAKGVNQALLELKAVDGAISKLNKRYLEAKDSLKQAIGAKQDPKVIQSLREEVQAFSKGVDNALAFQKMLQRVNAEISKISDLRKLNIGVDKSKLDEAEALIKKFKNDLMQVTKTNLLGTDFTSYLSKYQKALGLTLTDVKTRIDAFKKDNSLTDAASHTAMLERKLANVQTKMERIRELMKEAYSGKYDSSSLLSGFNRLNSIKSRISKMLGDSESLNNEAKYRQLLSDIGTVAAKTAADIEKYKTAKSDAARTRTEQDNTAFNTAKIKDVASIIRRVNDEYRSLIAEGIKPGLHLEVLVNQIRAIEKELNSLTVQELKAGNTVTDVLKRTGFGTLRREIKETISELQKGESKSRAEYRQSVENIERLRTAYRRLYDMLAKAYEARNRGKTAGIDTTRLDRDIEYLKGKMQDVKSMMQNVPNGSWKLPEEVATRLDAVSKHIKSAGSNMSALRTRTTETADAARSLASAFERVHSAASRSSQVMSDIKSLFLQGGIVYAAQSFANSIVQTGGDIVQQHIAVRSILGDIQQADELFGQVQQLALQSPFKFQQLNRDVKQLAAFGVDTDRLYDTTRRLADVSAGLGVSFERLGLAYGQVKARSWLDGKELRQFAYAGLPMLQKIADLYNETGKNGRNNYTTSDVRNMITKRQVSFEDVDAVFKELTDAGGQFYNMQFVLSDTLLGRWNKLEDAWSIMLGKFADGGNIIGKVFITAINGATEFVLALDKISPLLLSFGTVFGGRKLFGLAMSSLGLGLGQFSKEMALAEKSALKTYATARMQEVMEGKITAQKAEQLIISRRQLLSSAETKNLTYLQLAGEGKLSAMQIGQLARKGQITASTINELKAMGAINEQQAILLNQLRMEAAMRQGTTGTMLRYSAVSAGQKISGIFSAGNLAMLGASVGLALWLGYSQWSNRVNESIRTMTDSAKQKAKQFGDFLDSDKGNKDVTQNRIDSMKELLESSGEYSESIKNQVDSAKDLNEQYNILHKTIKDLKDNNENMANGYGAVVENAFAATGLEKDKTLGDSTPKWLRWFYGLDNDSMDKNVEQAQQSIQQYQVMFDTLDEKTQASMEKFIQGVAAKNKELAQAIEGMPVAEQIRILAYTGGDDWENFVQRFSNGSEETEKWLEELSDRAKESSDDVSEIMYDDVPKALDSVREQLGMSQDEFKIWCAKNPKLFASMMDQMAKDAKITSQEILTWFHRAVSELLNFNFWHDNGNGGGGRYRPGVTGGLASLIRDRFVSNNRYANGGRKAKGGYYWSEIDTFLRNVQDTSWDKTAENILKEYRTEKKELDRLNASGASKNSSYYRSVKHKVGMISQMMSYGGITDEKENKKANQAERKREQEARKEEQEARKADQDDERRLKARLSLIKDAYETYKKYYNLLHDERTAAKEVSEQYKDKGLSNDDVSKITSAAGYRSLIEDYITMARGMNYRRPAEMKERKDEDIASGVKALNDFDYTDLSNKMTEFSSSVSLNLDKMSKSWNAFKTMLSATGDAEAAANMSGLGSDMNARDWSVYANKSYSNGFVRSYSDYIKNYLDSIILNSKHPDISIDYDKVVNMSDEEISKYVGRIFSGTEGNEIAGFIEALKKLRDVVTDTEYQEGLNTFGDLMNKIVTVAANTDRENARYNDVVKQLDIRHQNGMSDEQYSQAMSVANAEHDHNLLTATDAYNQFMSSVTSMTEDAAKDMYNKILDDLAEQLSAGTISAQEYVEALEKVSDQMDEFSFQHSDTYSFLTGGLEGLMNNRKKKAYNAIMKDLITGKGELVDKSTKRLTSKGLAVAKNGGKGASAVAMVDTIVNGINNNVQSYKQLEQTWTNAFGDGLKNSKFNNFMSGFTEASQGAADAWNSLKSGNFVGVLDGGIRSFTGWFSFSNAAANNRWKKQAEYLKGFQTTLSEINSTLKSKINSEYGSQSVFNAYRYKNNLQNEAEEIRETYYDWSQAHTIHRNHRNRMYLFGGKGETKSDFRDINETLRENGYTGPEIGGDTIQNLSGKWLELIKETHAGFWSKMNDEAKEYLNRIIEIEGETGELTELNKQVAEALSGLTTSGLLSDYELLIESFEATNSDFADDFENKLKKAILNSMLANLYKDSIENLVNEAGELGKNEYYLDKYGNIKQHVNKDKDGNYTYDESDIATEYTPEEYENLKQANQELGSSINETAKMIQDAFGFKSGSSSTLSSSISSTSEETSDLLASYLNAIRADVSVIRQLTIPDLDSIDVTTKAQLQQLNMITQNTKRNADAAESMKSTLESVRDILSSSQKNQKPLYVNVK